MEATTAVGPELDMNTGQVRPGRVWEKETPLDKNSAVNPNVTDKPMSKKDFVYVVLKDVKQEVAQMSLKIQQQEDMLKALKGNIRVQEEKKTKLKLTLAQLEMEAKLAESNNQVGVLKKESLVCKIEAMKKETESIEQQIPKKQTESQELSDLFAVKQQRLLELETKQKAAYMKFARGNAFIQASERCSGLAKTAETLTEKLDQLKAKYGPLPLPASQEQEEQTDVTIENDSNVVSQNDKDFLPNSQKRSLSQPSLTDVIQLESSGTVVSPEIRGIQEVLAKFAELAEENKTLKERLERLELANQASFPRDKEKSVSVTDDWTMTSQSQSTPSTPVEQDVPYNDENDEVCFKRPTPPAPKKFTFSKPKAKVTAVTLNDKPFFDDNTVLPEKALTQTSLSPISFGGVDDCMAEFNFAGTPGGSFF